MTDPKLKVLISAEKIQERIRELGEKISADYPTGNLHMICILKGAIYFMTDLSRAMKRDVQIDFIAPVHLGEARPQEALRFFKSDDLGRDRSRHQGRRAVRA